MNEVGKGVIRSNLNKQSNLDKSLRNTKPTSFIDILNDVLPEFWHALRIFQGVREEEAVRKQYFWIEVVRRNSVNYKDYRTEMARKRMLFNKRGCSFLLLHYILIEVMIMVSFHLH